jgi:hypothetical protein
VFLRPTRADFADTGCASSSLLTRDVKMRAAACRSRADRGWLLSRWGDLDHAGHRRCSTVHGEARRTARQQVALSIRAGFRELRLAGDRRQGALVPISPAKTVLAASRWARRAARRLRVSHIRRSQGSAGRYGSAGRRAAGPARSAWRYRGATPPRLPPGPRYSKAAPG